MREVYLDYAAATPVDARVMQVMLPFFTQHYGNPGSVHALGQYAADAVQSARQSIARVLGCFTHEVLFTGSGTESVNLALQGVAFSLMHKGRHIITQASEHHAVLHTLEHLQSKGFRITVLKPDNHGVISATQVENAIQPDTILCSIMYANNEVGTVQPLAELSKVCQSRGVLFHSDACQAAGLLPLRIQEIGVDLLSLDAGKMYGPKGVGILYVRSGVSVTPLVFGGAQEYNHRAGTEHVVGIVGAAKALEIAELERKTEVPRLAELRDLLIKELVSMGCQLNGSATQSLANNVSVIFPRCEAERFVLQLSERGVYASTGSACTSKTMQSSHVLLAIGLQPAQAHGTVRFTLGRFTAKEDVMHVIQTIKQLVGPVKVAIC